MTNLIYLIKLASRTKESRIRRGLNNAIKLYKLIISEKLRPVNKKDATSSEAATHVSTTNSHSNFNGHLNGGNNKLTSHFNSVNNGFVVKTPVKEETATDFGNETSVNGIASHPRSLNCEFNKEYVSFNSKE
jgi:hypothetical protein